MQEAQVQFLSQEDPLEKEMATHSSILARRLAWTEEPGRLQPMGPLELDRHELATKPPPPLETGFIFLGSKITVDGDCSHEIKRCLLLGRKAMTNLGSILKSRDITSLIKVCIVKAMVFPIVMYECESWSIKKAEHQRIGALNCGDAEDSSDTFVLQGDQTRQS